jgi:DNA helicase-2/ATP-dependent DNA helicase PcrA
MKKLILKKNAIAALPGIPQDSPRTYRIRYEQELNQAQLQAVFHGKGPALVLAGAGTGKTRILVYRLARLVEDGIAPQNILLLTFTRKSAAEMLRRAAILLDGRCEQVSGGTFHSFAHSILRQHAELLGFGKNFSVLDQADMEDALNLLRGRITADTPKKRFPLKHTLAAMYSMSVNKCMPLEDILALHYPQFAEEYSRITTLFRMYVEYKHRQNLMDYDDLLVYLLTLLDEKPAVSKELQFRFRYILADEYQDTNLLQHRIVMALAGNEQNIMAVGDDAQSIYSFRGANFQNILEFPRSFPDCAIYTIEQNYRSSQPVLDISNAIMQDSLQGYRKNLFSIIEQGPAPLIISAASERQQSEFIVQQILELRDQGHTLGSMAALIRSGYMSFDLEIELSKANIPFRKFGGFRFIETAHIKDILSYFRIISNPKDILAWHRLLMLQEGIGTGTATMITDELTAGTLDYRLDIGWNSIPRGKDSVLALCTILRKITGDQLSPSEQGYLISEHYRPILKKKYDDFQKRWKDIETFLTILDRYSTVSQLLSEMALDPPAESAEAEAELTDEDYFTISTIHSAKGLEWNTVFLPWTLEGRFPPNKSLITIEQTEEERRLMYVAVTRAREYLYIIYPVNIFDRESGSVLGTPSRFLNGISVEMAERCILIDGDEE